jgi:hypothetical protein
VAIENLVNSLGRTKVVAIRYGAWSSDDYNQNNPSENNDRVAYYGQGTGTPQAWVDGIYHMLGSAQIPANVGTYTNNRLAIPAPYEIDSDIDINASSVTVKVKCTAAPPSANNYLRIAVIEKVYDWPTAPGSNGQTHFENCMLDMVPDAQGTLLNIAVGDSQTFTFNYDANQVNFHPPASFNALVSLVTFVQNDQNREILQANYDEVGITIGSPFSSSFISSSGSTNLTGYAYSTSNINIDLDVAITGSIPNGWNINATSNQGDITINGGSQVFSLSGQDSFTFNIFADSQGNPGGIVLTTQISLSSNPSLSTSLRFYVTTDEVDLLVIDATEYDYCSYVLNSLDRVYSGLYGAVSRDIFLEPNLNLNSVQTLIWSGANTLPAFYPEEVAVLQSFLDNGGCLFISGQDIGNDVFAANGQSRFAQSFYNNYLHSSFVNNTSTFFLVNGYAGDPITDGLSFIIGDFYTRSPEIIAAYDTLATPILKYWNSTNVAGIRAADSEYKVVYLGIGFEQIFDEPDRDSILVRSIRWFNEVPTSLNDHPAVAISFRLLSNYPNPFNPETIIQYTLDNLTAEATRLLIYNSLGQLTRQLVKENQSAGNYQVSWDGKDDFGRPVASGIYYCQLVNGNKKAIQKMILLR